VSFNKCILIIAMSLATYMPMKIACASTDTGLLPGEAQGQMTVSGEVEATNNYDKRVLLSTGLVKIRIIKPSPIFNLMNYIRNYYFIEIEDESQNVFQFEMPAEVFLGVDSLYKAKNIDQPLHSQLTMSLTTHNTLMKTYDESSERLCSFDGYCESCATGKDGVYSCMPNLSLSCPGVETVVYNMSEYMRTLEFEIKVRKKGTATIVADLSRAVRKNKLVSRSSCMPE